VLEKFETMRPPTACGTDNHALLRGLRSCVPARESAERAAGSVTPQFQGASDV
jgi:hypothetical protein